MGPTTVLCYILIPILVLYTRAEPPVIRDPSSVMVVQLLQGRRSAVCSGVLVTLEWVTTAYSCKKNVYYTPDIIEHFELYVGVQNFQEVLEDRLPEGAQMRSSVEFRLHPHHECDYPDNNVMLIKVFPAFDETRGARPARLPDRSFGSELRTCNVWGYGAEEGRMFGRNYLHHLRPREVEVEDQCRCRLGKEYWHEKFLCNRVENGSHSLGFGDFGAGLLCDGDLYGVFTALLSKEEFEGGDCLTDLLGTHVLAGTATSSYIAVFASVPGNFEWIRSQTKSYLGDPPKECSFFEKLYRYTLCIFFPCVLSDFKNC